MSDFVGSLKQIEQNSWQAAGLLSANGGRQMFDTVCKPRRFANEAAGQAFLAAWALKHNAQEVAINVERLGD